MNNIEYFFGRKNQRTNYKLYKKVYKDNPVHKFTWWTAGIIKGKLTCWHYCNMLPEDMRNATIDEAEQFLFEYCLQVGSNHKHNHFWEIIHAGVCKTLVFITAWWLGEIVQFYDFPPGFGRTLGTW